MVRREKKAAAAATPAITMLHDAHVVFTEHQYVHDPDVRTYGMEAATALGVLPDRVFKTLVVALPTGLGVAVLPVDTQLDLKAAGAGLGAKKVALAEQAAAERATGYVVGGISPLGQRTRLPTVVDDSATDHATVFVSGGRRGLEIELAPRDLITLTDARTAPITR